MRKLLAIALSLSPVLLPSAAAARGQEVRERWDPRLDALATSQATTARLGDRPLELMLSFGSQALERPTRTASAMGLGLVYLRSIAGSVAFLGSGVGYYRALSDISGSTTAGGGTAELLLTPRFVSVPLAFKLAISPRLYAALEPALVVGWVSAAVRHNSGTRLDISSNPGIGCQLTAGFDAHLTGRLGLAFRLGYRAVRPSLKVTPLGDAGEPLTDRAEHIGVDLSGVFWNAGLVLEL